MEMPMSDSPENPDAERRALREKQQRELKEFEERQRRELEAFEKHEEEELEKFEQEEHKEFEIRIDRTEYKVHQHKMTGAELRRRPEPPIGPDRDLFEVVPGGSDKKIGDHDVVEIRNGLRFFTAPAQINPG
jgi:hypothetical protein